MVQVSTEQTINQNIINIDDWLTKVNQISPIFNANDLRDALNWLRDQIKDSPCDWDEDISCFKVSLELGETVASLRLEQDAVIAAILYRAARENKITLTQIKTSFNEQIYHLVATTLKLVTINEAPEEHLKLASKNQLDVLRKMLVALVDDVRVVLIKIAERTCAMRLAKNTDASRRIAIAKVTADIYAPLAHRLGIGHLKWELEDLAFRYLEPENYQYIAKLLQEKRLEREQFIANAIQQLSNELNAAQITAEISGRVKHIYSIWRKMQLKNLSFNQLYDIRALRVLVENERDCYTALGVIHHIWQHIPREFDDYIASPKPNGYRSLHTAVFGPDNKTLEVQIRTFAMHEEAEFGLYSHWSYKGVDTKNSDNFYAAKIDKLRQSFADYVTDTINSEPETIKIDDNLTRIYVFTPDDHVIDLAKGSTVLDFAYRIHTEVGHSCRGAKVNGNIVPLRTKLETGQKVEILTAKNATPSRDWLNPNLEYLTSPKARAKILAWFKSADRNQNIALGKSAVEREFKQLSINDVNLNELATSLKFANVEDMFADIGAGSLKITQILGKIETAQHLTKDEQFHKRASKYKHKASDITIAGVRNMLTNIANCCKPVPGDPIVGYITNGRGVSIHRQDCIEVLQLSNNEPQRIIQVNWNTDNTNTYPVDIRIEAFDRVGLLHDVTAVIKNERLNLLAMQTKVNTNTNDTIINITVETSDMHTLRKLLNKIMQLPNVCEVKRC